MDQANNIDDLIEEIIIFIRMVDGDFTKLDSFRKTILESNLQEINEMANKPYFDTLPVNQFQANCMLEKIKNSFNDISKVDKTVYDYGCKLGLLLDPYYINISIALGAIAFSLQKEIKELEKVANQPIPETDTELLSMFRGNNNDERKQNFERFRAEYNGIIKNKGTREQPQNDIMKAFVKYMDPNYRFGNSSRDCRILAKYGIFIDRRYFSSKYISEHNLL